MHDWRVAKTLFLGTLMLVLVGCGADPVAPPREASYEDQAAAAMREPSAEVRAKQLARLGYRRAQAKDEMGAKQTFATASEAARQIEDPAARADALSLLARAQAKTGFSAEARKSVAEAAEAIEVVEQAEMQARQLASVAQAQAALSDIDTARQSLRRAEQITAELVDPQCQPDLFARAITLRPIAEVYQETGLSAEAERVLSQLLSQAQALEDPLQRFRAVLAVAAARQTMKRPDTAEGFALARDTAARIEEPNGRALALVELAEALVAAKQPREAYQTLEEAEKVAHQIPENDLEQQALERIHRLMDTLPRE